MTRIELIKTPCWSCWYREGAHCHDEAQFGEGPKDGIYFIGHEITPQHIKSCNNHLDKRFIFGNAKNIEILSEHAKHQSNQSVDLTRKRGGI